MAFYGRSPGTCTLNLSAPPHLGEAFISTPPSPRGASPHQGHGKALCAGEEAEDLPQGTEEVSRQNPKVRGKPKTWPMEDPEAFPRRC